MRKNDAEEWSELAGDAHVYHVGSHHEYSNGKNLAEHPYVETLEQTGTCKGAEQYADKYGAGNAGDDVAALDVYYGRGACRNPHHEVRCGGAHLEGNLHHIVHGNDLEHSGTDAEDSA